MNANIILLAIAVVFLSFHVYSGWRQGVAREFVAIISFLVAYAVAWFGGQFVTPAFRTFGYPDFILRILAGALLGLIAFLVVRGIGAILFKKTNQQSVGIIRFGYGLGGAVLGLAFGIICLWAAAVGFRVVGSVAKLEVEAKKKSHTPSSQWIEGLAEAKTTVDSSAAGPILKEVDPIPQKAYDVLAKVVRMSGEPESMQRFMNFPGVAPLTRHPKIIALQKDPDIAELIKQREFMALLRHERLVAAANDPELGELLRKFELEKALDFALRPNS